MKSAKPIHSPSGLLLLDKPAGVTSFDCVAVVRRRLGVQRVGHCGTLDPAARGLLLVLVGPSTRAQNSFLGLEKEYEFKAELGRKTSTGDREGSVIEEKPFAHVTRETLDLVLKTFEGDTSQLPPVYSALKYKGKPYYAYARKGLEVPRQPRPIHISLFTLLSLAFPFWDARVVCSRGTYVRTLVEDVAERLGTCGTLTELVRERIGDFRRSQALSWDDLRSLPVENLLSHLQPVVPFPAAVHA